MTTTVRRLAIALTSTTAIVAAFTLAATPPTVETAAASPAHGTSVVIDLSDQHDEGRDTAATADDTGRSVTARYSTTRDC